MDWFERTRKKYGKPIVWVHPLTGEYRIPPDEDAPMPERYKMQGYEVREFSSYFEHQKWCRDHGLVNHFVEGIKEDQDALNKNRWGY